MRADGQTDKTKSLFVMLRTHLKKVPQVCASTRFCVLLQAISLSVREGALPSAGSSIICITVFS
jgi:hypothetical protein